MSDEPPSSPPVKVLQICAVDFTLARFLAPLCFHLQERGFDVTAACTESTYMEGLRRRGLRCVNLPIERSRNLAAHVASYRTLSRWLAEERFDIVHVHTPIAALIGRLAAARRRVPIRIYTAHGFYFHDRMPAWKRWAHIALERFGAFCHHFLFTQSEEDRRSAIACGIARPDRVLAIGNGVDLTRFSPERFTTADRIEVRRTLGIAPEAPVLSIIGRLVREKGYFELFRATRLLKDRVPGLRVLVIGDALASDHDDSTRQLHALIQELGLGDSVVLVGQRDDVPELLHASDVFTLPSWREGMPRSVIEAMAMGLPAVVTNIRGCREEVVNGETGSIVEVGDVESLARACENLLGDPELARQYGRAGRLRAGQLYSESAVFKRQLDVYHRLIRERLPAGRPHAARTEEKTAVP